VFPRPAREWAIRSPPPPRLRWGGSARGPAPAGRGGSPRVRTFVAYGKRRLNASAWAGTGPAGTPGQTTLVTQPPARQPATAGHPARPDHQDDARHDHRWSVRAQKALQIGRALPSTPSNRGDPAPCATPVAVTCSLQRALHRELRPVHGGRRSHLLVSAQECGKPPARDANSHRSDGKVGQGVEKWDKVGYGGAQQTTGVAGLLPLRHSGLDLRGDHELWRFGATTSTRWTRRTG
jgi:hypothetical protein